MKNYQPGDIVAVEQTGIFPFLSRTCIDPSTRLFHFLLIGNYIKRDNDYEIFESIGKGVAIGRLSWYDTDKYKVFRYNSILSEDIGESAVEAASKFGRTPYDYALFLKFFADFIRHGASHLLRFQKIPKMRPADLHYVKNAAFVCTEFVVASFQECGVKLLELGDAPVPAAFVKAVNGGRFILVDQHDSTSSQVPGTRIHGKRVRK